MSFVKHKLMKCLLLCVLHTPIGGAYNSIYPPLPPFKMLFQMTMIPKDYLNTRYSQRFLLYLFNTSEHYQFAMCCAYTLCDYKYCRLIYKKRASRINIVHHIYIVVFISFSIKICISRTKKITLA